jgi:hypothetical protein
MQRLLAVLLVLACSCHSTSTKLSAGKGIVSSDSQAPAGAKSFEPPHWKAGDRFVFEKGGRVRIAVRVEVAEDGHYELVDESSGRRMLYTRELAELGEHPAPIGRLDAAIRPGRRAPVLADVGRQTLVAASSPAAPRAATTCP